MTKLFKWGSFKKNTWISAGRQKNSSKAEEYQILDPVQGFIFTKYSMDWPKFPPY